MNDHRNVKKQIQRNWLVDLGLFLAALGAAITGIYFLVLPVGGYQGGRNPFYGITFLFGRETWDSLHTWTGVGMIAAALIHLLLHWSWVVGIAKRIYGDIFRRSQRLSPTSRINMVVDLVVAIGFFLTALSGLYFLFGPAGVPSRSLPPFIFSAQTWDLIHTWAFVVMTAGVMIHLALHWSWIASVGSRLLAPSKKTKTITAPVEVRN